MKNVRKIQNKDFKRPFLALMDDVYEAVDSNNLAIVYPDLKVERFQTSGWFTSCFSYDKDEIKYILNFVSYI